MMLMELEELLEQIDIVEYISRFVELEERNGEFWGLSPFKEEKTPSFSVRRETGRFYDFSSGLGGNALTFIRAYFKCSRRESLEKLKEYAGYSGVVYAPPEKMDATLVCKKFAPVQNKPRTSSPHILPKEYMDLYENRPDKLSVWKDEGISEESLKKFNVRYDGLMDQIVYPVHDLSGNLVNVGYRVLDPQWKEKKMHKYGYKFDWGGQMNVIYGLYNNLQEIKNRHEVILFEGCKSVLKADSWGIRNSAALSTSHLNPGQMKILAKLGCDVMFMLDKEIRIRDDKNIKALSGFVNVYYYYDWGDLLDEKDAPVDHGEEVFRKLYTERRLKLR